MRLANQLFHAAAVLLAAALFASCAIQGLESPAGTSCDTKTFRVSDDFSGARRGSCTVTGDSSARLEILPEDDGVSNPSPWFAFKLTPKTSGIAEIVLDYQNWEHRYSPKISGDGSTWRLLPGDFVTVSDDGRRATLRVPLTDEPVWIAAQELITPAVHHAWNQQVAERFEVRFTELGKSRKGRPIHAFDSNPDVKDVILLVGRQHPPEVSGVFAVYSFLETLFSNSELAETFRQHYRIIAIPLLNPDGASNGNWRHNLGGVDLNRDWGSFTQPETKLVASLLNDLDASNSRVRLFIDFHSTKRNLFYTQDELSVTDPPGFARAWLKSSATRLRDYQFTNEERPASDPTRGKNYMYERYGVPSLTYEVGDETEREVAREAAKVFAEEMMRLMLSQRR